MGYKRTKIVATISDLRCDVPLLRKLFEAGMNAVRINTAHATLEGAKKVIVNTRKVSDRIAIIIDTKGPEIRTTEVEEKIALKKGQRVKVSSGKGMTSEKHIHVTYKDFVSKTPKGAMIFIDDGEIALKVASKSGGVLTCIVQNKAVLGSNKSINVPGANYPLPTLNAKDKTFLAFAKKHKVDFIAHSFVRNKRDVQDVAKYLRGSKVKIIAKIENQSGVDNVESILDVADGIMVARGDLAMEVPAEAVPVVQKTLIRKSIDKGKIVITATQMLHSMIDSPRPTRAEVSDVANAIMDGTDAIMLSGETASGRFPLEAVRTMSRIARATESEKHREKMYHYPEEHDVSNYLFRCAVKAGNYLPTKAIVIATTTGYSAKMVSRYRGSNVIFARCFEEHVVRELCLVYGIHPYKMDRPKQVRKLVPGVLNSLVKGKKLSSSDLIVLLTGIPGRGKLSTTLDILTIKDALNKYS